MKVSQRLKMLVLFTLCTGSLIAISGCLRVLIREKHETGYNSGESYGEAELSTFKPDNCTQCHLAWTKQFDYYRGWDRYGYIYGDDQLVGFYDPWCFPSVKNTFQDYYTTDWWETPELYVWPDDIGEKVESLSVLYRDRDLFIPKRIEEIEGPVHQVALTNAEYTSIQKAVDRAQPGSTVFVRSGEYHETVTLKEGVNLIGEDPYTTVINPLNKGHGVIASNHSIIAGFTFTGTGLDYKNSQFNAAVYVSGCDSTCIIANNIFSQNGLFGVWIEGTTDEKKSQALEVKHGDRSIELFDRPYRDYPNPIIAGNTFYRIGQRGVFCVHARGEVFNNIFLGNVKAAGMERHSRPFFHHNVFFFNNVPLAINRSEPIICNNIMYRNQWGQRMLRGANPVMFNNVTWKSPHFRDFDETGNPIPYDPHPGTGENELDPGFVNPMAGDFHFSETSPLKEKTTGFDAVGIMRDTNVPQPLNVPCSSSWGREVLSMTDDIVELIDKVDIENAKIRTLEANYRIIYEGYLHITPDTYGNPSDFSLVPQNNPVVHVEYEVSHWTMQGSKRSKRYHEYTTRNGITTEDSGTVEYSGKNITATDGRFSKIYHFMPDSLFVGERPFRETPGGFYRDYDQFVKGAIGPTGTFYHGYMRILGGRIERKTADIDGHTCMIVRYPHIGKDQYFHFYLDPAIGYRPRKMEFYYHGARYCVFDSYRYKEFPNNIYLPVYVKITDFAVQGSDRGKIVAEWELTVDEKNLKVNGRNSLSF